MLFIFSMPVLIRHLWLLKTVVFLHWCLICSVYWPFLCFLSFHWIIKNVENCLNNNIYSYLETFVGQCLNLYILMLFIFSMPVLIRHLCQFKTIVFPHWCLICSYLLTIFLFFKFPHNYKKCRKLFEYQCLLLLREICWSKFKSIFKCCSVFQHHC